jgi:hypothetical protein
MVGRLTLDQVVKVRILAPQPHGSRLPTRVFASLDSQWDNGGTRSPSQPGKIGPGIPGRGQSPAFVTTRSAGWFRPRRFRGLRPQETPGYAESERRSRFDPGPGSCHSTRCRHRSSWRVLVPRCFCRNRKKQRLESPEGPLPRRQKRRRHSAPRQQLRRSQPRTSCALMCLPVWTPPWRRPQKSSLIWPTKRRQPLAVTIGVAISSSFPRVKVRILAQDAQVDLAPARDVTAEPSLIRGQASRGG